MAETNVNIKQTNTGVNSELKTIQEAISDTNAQENADSIAVKAVMPKNEPPVLSASTSQQEKAPQQANVVVAPTTPEEVDQTLQSFQQTMQDNLDTLENSELSAEEVEAQVNEMMQELVIPEPPKLTDLYTQLAESTGLNNITERLTTLKQERATIEDRLRSRMSYIQGQQVSMDVIGGQTSEVQRQEQQNLQYINSAIQITVEEQQGALSYIQTYVTLTGQDYQNALNHYTTVFDTKMKAIQMINDAKQVEWSQEMELIKWEQGVAQSQLAMYADMIANGTMFLGNLSEEEKAEIGRLEVQAGLPLGFLSKVQIDSSKLIQSITQRQGSDGYMYSDVVKIDPQTGALTVDSIKLGKFYVAPRSSRTTTTTTKNSYGFTSSEWNSAIKNAGETLREFEKNQQKAIHGEDEGDMKMAEWERKQLAESLADQYGDAGYEIFDQAWKQSGFSVWTPK